MTTSAAVHVHDDVLARLAAELDELEHDLDSPVTARRVWHESWFRAHADWSVLAVTVHDDVRLTAAAVLARRRGVLFDEIRPAGAGASDEVRLPALDDQAARALAVGIDRALRDLGRPWRLVLRDTPPEDPVLAHLAQLLPHASLASGDISPRLLLGAGRELRGYVSRNHHQQSRRLLNRLSRDGHCVETSQVTDPADIAQVLPEVITVCRARDHELRRRSRLDGGPDLAFFCHVVAAHALRGEVELTTLRVDRALAAYVLCFRDGNAWRMWNCRFDPRWSSYGVGRLSHDASLAAALAQGATLYDWMRGDESYKAALSDHVYRAADLFAASNLALWSTFEGARRTRRVLRDAKNRSRLASRAWERIRPALQRLQRP